MTPHDTMTLTHPPFLEKMLDDILRREGGFVNHPNDPGGPTNYGITRTSLGRFLGKPATIQELKELKPETAKNIYNNSYYTIPRIFNLPEEIQPFSLDSSVNHGARRAIRFVQRVCNESLVGPLKEDGLCGSRTAKAAYNAQNELENSFLERLIDERRQFYTNIVDINPSQSVFIKGWMNRLKEFEN